MWIKNSDKLVFFQHIWWQVREFAFFFMFHFNFSLKNDREMAKIFLFSLPKQWELFRFSLFTSHKTGSIFSVFSFHFPNNKKSNFFSFYFPPNGNFFLFSFFSSQNYKTISRWTVTQAIQIFMFNILNKPGRRIISWVPPEQNVTEEQLSTGGAFAASNRSY